MLARTHHADSQTPTALRLYHQYQTGKSPAEVFKIIIKIQSIFAFVTILSNYQMVKMIKIRSDNAIGRWHFYRGNKMPEKTVKTLVHI